MENLKTYTLESGEVLYYTGNPEFSMLERLAAGPGHLWHSGLDQGCKNLMQEIIYQSNVMFWYVNDFLAENQSVSWRCHPNAFVVRKSTWDFVGGFDLDFMSPTAQALDFAFQLLRFYGGVPLYVKGLFPATETAVPAIAVTDRYRFFLKSFKPAHAYYMLFRKGIYSLSEWSGLIQAKKNTRKRVYNRTIPVRKLTDTIPSTTVSYIIPTMMRQELVLNLLDDINVQTVLPTEVIIVDATPDSDLEKVYFPSKYRFHLRFYKQTSKGSCRARNEAIEASKGEYIVFGDDDIRIPPDYIENHLKFLITYGVNACNGLDTRCQTVTDGLDYLATRLNAMQDRRWFAGVTSSFNNANSCIKASLVKKIGGNDVNFDGGYGEDSDFGHTLAELGEVILSNPFSTTLHLRPESGGYRWWGNQAKILGKKRKAQPWELGVPVGFIRPVPSPTIMYGILKHFSSQQLNDYKYKHYLHFLQNGSKWFLPARILYLPYKELQFHKSLFYAKRLVKASQKKI